MAHILKPILVISLVKDGVGGRVYFNEDILWDMLEKYVLQILIEVAFIQVSILGADEE